MCTCSLRCILEGIISYIADNTYFMYMKLVDCWCAQVGHQWVDYWPYETPDDWKYVCERCRSFGGPNDLKPLDAIIYSDITEYRKQMFHKTYLQL